MFHKQYMYSKTCRDTAYLAALKITLLRKVIRVSHIMLDRHFQYTQFFPVKLNWSQKPDLMRTHLLETEDRLISKTWKMKILALATLMPFYMLKFFWSWLHRLRAPQKWHSLSVTLKIQEKLVRLSNRTTRTDKKKASFKPNKLMESSHY